MNKLDIPFYRTPGMWEGCSSMKICLCKFSRIVWQVNVCCDIHVTFVSGPTYSNDIDCLICGVNKIL